MTDKKLIQLQHLLQQKKRFCKPSVWNTGGLEEEIYLFVNVVGCVHPLVLHVIRLLGGMSQVYIPHSAAISTFQTQYSSTSVQLTYFCFSCPKECQDHSKAITKMLRAMSIISILSTMSSMSNLSNLKCLLISLSTQKSTVGVLCRQRS